MSTGSMPVGDVWPEIALLAGALAVVMLASFTRQSRQPWSAAAALGVIALALAGFAADLGAPPQLTFSGTFASDGATAFAAIIALAATAVVVISSPEWLHTDRRHGEFHAVLLLSALGTILMAGATDLAQLVVALLLASVTGYTLAAWHRSWPLSVEAGMKYFLIGALANAFLLLGVVLLFGLAGTTGYAALAERLAEADRVALLAAVAMVVLGIGWEAAAVPAHAWMPDVAEGAPAPAAAFLTVVPKIGATVALARFVELVPVDSVDWRTLLAVVAAATMTVGNLAALRQDDVRRLLGWSAVAQSGYALIGVAAIGGSGHALPSLLFFLAAYAVANLAAFAAVVELRGRTAIDDYRGLLHERPLVGVVLALALLSLVGIPPLAGFVGKLALFTAAIDGGLAWLAVVAVANTVVSLFYSLRVIARTAFDRAPAPVPVLGRYAAIAMAAAGFGTLALGIAAEVLLGPLAGISLLP